MPGYDADLAVIDEGEEWTVAAAGLHNKNRYTALEGWTLTGRVRETWVRGRPVFRRLPHGGAWFAGAPAGRWIRRGEAA